MPLFDYRFEDKLKEVLLSEGPDTIKDKDGNIWNKMISKSNFRLKGEGSKPRS